MSNEIVLSGSSFLDIPTSPQMIDAYAEKLTNVAHMEDVEKIVNAFDEQEELLSKAKEYSEKRARYSALEAATYKRIVDKGWASALGSSNKFRRVAAEWLSSHPEEYEKCINAILYSDMTLISYWRSREKQVASERFSIRFKRERKTFLESYAANGQIDLNRFGKTEYGYGYATETEKFDTAARVLAKEEETLDRYLGASPSITDDDYSYAQVGDKAWFYSHVAHMRGQEREKFEDELTELGDTCINDLRVRLRKLGAVGIGNGIYVDKEKCGKEINSAIRIRRKNVTACILRLHELCATSDKYSFNRILSDAITATHLPITVKFGDPS